MDEGGGDVYGAPQEKVKRYPCNAWIAIAPGRVGSQWGTHSPVMRPLSVSEVTGSMGGRGSDDLEEALAWGT